MNSYEKFHLIEVINASGKMTILGVSKVSEAVLAAQRFGGEHFFEMSELSVQTGAFLADLLKVEDAQIVSPPKPRKRFGHLLPSTSWLKRPLFAH